MSTNFVKPIERLEAKEKYATIAESLPGKSLIVRITGKIKKVELRICKNISEGNSD